jgi:glycosyltransferase involved in cell wall biosynthesis
MEQSAIPPIADHELAICIPAYNEEQAIGRVLAELKRAFPRAEVIMVDDGSTDATASRAAEVPGVTILGHEWNQGYGAALKTAMRAASRPVVVWCDSDGQHRPADVARVAGPVLAGEKEVMIGVRGGGGQVRARLPWKKLFTWVTELIARQRIPDVNSGLRAFRTEIIRRYLSLLPDGFSASTTTTLLMMKRRYRVGHAPISTRARTGSSKVRMLSDGWRTLQLMFRVLIMFEAFAFFSVLGAAQAGAGLVYGLYVAALRGQGLSTLAALLMLSGVFTFLTGIVCDQVTELRKEKLEQ